MSHLFVICATSFFEMHHEKIAFAGLQMYGVPGSLSHDFKI